jgi:hypothetical protein
LVFFLRIFFCFSSSFFISSSTDRERLFETAKQRKRKITTKKKENNINNKKEKERKIFVYKEIFLCFYISAFIRSDEEIVEGRIFTLGVTKSPSLALPEGECDDGGTTATDG